MSLEHTLEQIVDQLHSPDAGSVHTGLGAIDTLLFDLCRSANPNGIKQHSQGKPASAAHSRAHRRGHSLDHSCNNHRRSRSKQLQLQQQQHLHRHRHSLSSMASNTSTSSSTSSSNEASSLYSSRTNATPASSIESSPVSTTHSPIASSPLSIGTRKWRVPNCQDPVFGQFVALQNRFEYNLASHLVDCVRDLLRQDTSSHDSVCLALRNLQGCLLLHPPSRDIFRRRYNLQLLLSLLDPATDNAVVLDCVPVLVSSLVRNVRNIRLFEQLDGPKVVCTLLKSKAAFDKDQSSKQVQVKVLEFLFFYLIPESQTTTVIDGVPRRTMENKMDILNQHLNKEVTQSLAAELLESRPFGRMDIEW